MFSYTFLQHSYMFLHVLHVLTFLARSYAFLQFLTFYEIHTPIPRQRDQIVPQMDSLMRKCF